MAANFSRSRCRIYSSSKAFSRSWNFGDAFIFCLFGLLLACLAGWSVVCDEFGRREQILESKGRGHGDVVFVVVVVLVTLEYSPDELGDLRSLN